MRDGHPNEVRVYKPQSEGSIPLVVLIHGGGFCLGHYTHISTYSRAVVSLTGATVVAISYRLAPEFKFPTAPHDVWDTINWLVEPEMAQKLGVNPHAGLYIGSISAGANLAAVTAQRWVAQNKSPQMSGVWLQIPWLLEKPIVPERYQYSWFSREQNAQALIINEHAMEFVKEAYKPDLLSPDFSPFNATNPHRGMPPVYLQICGQDPLRDDGLIYERALRDHGVSTRLDVYPGVPHGFADVYHQLEVSKKCRVDALRGVGWLFGNEPSDDECHAALLGVQAS
ncbi:alpha beta hydrolase fold-3 domain-containing protein [Colletotrichum truncatum]|uniref:Alpha beta hydrolase fold-3 domain-containing protein n=1 Tax=Colletotrichum truncatum TaxID=5467 RepID=A0ACC3ZLT3_COLTU|nr:alpha beta hydrolase fold-3 domain-containing protein [Colletotrichum truncatum]KAF6783952.1 alpha beta hydrolase fold-3 domain-containing protein [Colletotrichum truncatum]